MDDDNLGAAYKRHFSRTYFLLQTVKASIQLLMFGIGAAVGTITSCVVLPEITKSTHDVMAFAGMVIVIGMTIGCYWLVPRVWNDMKSSWREYRRMVLEDSTK